jgi:hypothetical protein
MATKAERRAARGRVSAYHESELAGLLHRAAAELWKFCFAEAAALTSSSSPASWTA